jgi:hypothetical protein
MIKLKKINLKNLLVKKNSNKKNEDQTWLEKKTKKVEITKRNQFYKSHEIIK